MLSFNIFRRQTRPYANRLPAKLARTAMLSVRVHDDVLNAYRNLALDQSMSVSEYVYRLLNDHLQQQDPTKTSDTK